MRISILFEYIPLFIPFFKVFGVTRHTVPYVKLLRTWLERGN